MSSVSDPFPRSKAECAELSSQESIRYGRQMILPEFGKTGQLRLKKASVLLIGLGGLGCPAATYLASAGVGRLGLMDPDRVDASNLHRQFLYRNDDVGAFKVEVAAARLKEINPHVEIEVIPEAFQVENALPILDRYDVVLDGTDNFETRYLVNDAAFFAKKPNVYGSIFRFEGQISVFAPHQGAPCYRCLFPEPPPSESIPNCAEAGVLGVLPGLVGSIQALEAIKWLAKEEGMGESLAGRLLHTDTLRGRWREIRLKRDPQCPLCGENPRIHTLKLETMSCSTDSNDAVPTITVNELSELLKQPEAPVLIDVREPEEFAEDRIPGSKLIPLGEIEARANELPQSETFYIHCLSGRRSENAIKRLQVLGLKHAVNVAGGIKAWREAGL